MWCRLINHFVAELEFLAAASTLLSYQLLLTAEYLVLIEL